MADIQSNINLDIDASGALATLRTLQRQISAFQQTMAKTGAMSNARLGDMQQNLVNSINSTGQFTASIQKVRTTTESFTNALEKNKLSMGQYFRYSMGATKTFGKGFKTEFDTIEKVARERVKTLQTQYIKLGRDGQGAMQAIAVRPQVLDMKDLGTQTAIAAQKAQLFNQLMSQGSTNLLNFGKNTQWAGRQLMVGFTIPLGIMGAAAAKEFKAIEEQVIRLERVYGDFTTTVADTEQATAQIKSLADEFTKYGVAVSKTIGLAADAAAMGSMGADLVAQVAEATRLAVLGGVQQEQALETTISLTSAFGVAREDLAKKTDFLNAVENQTMTSIEDLTTAIPKAGPVVQQLGGNVEDLTFFLTAMREGGINASESANALKSGLASLINPTAEASEMLGGFGINLQGIVEANKGNVKGIVIDFAKALDTLDPLNRAQAIEQLFGKFQFSRLSTLFQNVIKEGGQASRVLELTQTSAAELAALSARELGKVEASPLFQFEGAIERFKAALAPVGEEFMKAVTPLINFGTQILEGFNNMEGGVKQFSIVAVGAIGAIGPVLLMTIGLLMNGLANIVKGVLFVRNGFKGMGDQSNVLTQQLNYMNSEQLEAAAVSASLNQVHNTLIQTFTAEAGAVRNLAGAYGQAIAAQGAFMGPITTRGGGMKTPKKFAGGGIVRGPGTGTSDSVAALLSNGEAVIPAKSVARFPEVVNSLISGNIPGFANGVMSVGEAKKVSGLYKAPSAVADQTALMKWETLQKEQQAILKALSGNAKVSQTQLDQLVRMQASHVSPDTSQIDVNGKPVDIKNWKAKNLQADIGAINNYMNSLGANSKILKNFESVHLDKAAKELGMSIEEVQQELNNFKKGIHPSTKNAGRVFAAVAQTDPNYQGVAAGAAMSTRLKGDYFETLSSRAYDPKQDKKAAEQTNKRVARLRQIAGANITVQEEIVKEEGQTAAYQKSRIKAEKRFEEQYARVSGPARAKLTKNKESWIMQETENIEGQRKAANREKARLRKEKAMPTQPATKQTLRSRAGGAISRIGGGMGRLGMAGMVAGGALSAASMMGGPAGDAAGAIGGPLMAISGVASVLSMLPPKAALVVGALAAVAAGGMALKKAFDDGVKKSIDFNNSVGAGTKAVNDLAEASGNVTASTQMDAKRLASISRLNEQEVSDPTFGQQYLESEVGSSMVNSITEGLKDNINLSEVRDQIFQQMATAVVSGALDPEQARSVVAALGEKLKDPTFALGVNAKLLQLIGPNGENIQEDGISVSLKISEQGQQNLNQTISQALKSATEQGSNLNIFDALNKVGQAYGSIVSAGAVQIQQQQQLVDALTLEYQKKLEIANLEGNSTKAAELTEEYDQNRLKLLQEQKKTMEAVVKPYKEIIDNPNKDPFGMARGQMGQAMDAQIKKTYEGDPALAAIAQQAQDKIVGASGLDQTQEYEMKFLLSTGDIPPQAFVTLMDTFGKDSEVLTSTLNFVSNLGTAEGGQMIQIMNSFVNEDGTPKEQVQRNFVAMFENKNPEEQLALSDFLNQIVDLGGDVEVFVAMSTTNPDQFQKVMTDFEMLQAEAAKGPLNLVSVLSQMTSIDTAGMNALVSNQEWFNSLPPVQQVEYITKFTTVRQEIGPAQAAAWLKANGEQQQNLGSTSFREMGINRTTSRAPVANYGYTPEQMARATAEIAAASARTYVTTNAPANLPSTQPAPSGGGGGGGGGSQPEKPPTSFLDSVIKDMKEFTSASQGLTDNFQDSMNAIRSASASAFGGVSQQLRGLGIREDVISLMTGMSKEEWDQYKDQFFNFDAAGNITGFKTDLALISDKLKTITLGKFVDEQQKSISNASSQALGLSKLVSLGMSYANAYEMVEDAALAAAIANASSAEEIRKIIELANQARQVQSLADASESVAGTNAATDATLAGLKALIDYNSALSDAQVSAILASDELQIMLANFDNLSIDQLRVLNEALQDAARKEALEIQIKMQTAEGMQDLFNEGFGKAMEQFSAREQEIKIKFTALKDPFQDVIKSFSEQIEDMKEAPGGLDDLEADLQRIGEQEIDINKKYDERFKALDSIAKINERIAAQQRTQLSLSEALSMGDIAAAARVAQEMRANDAAQALVDQREALQKSQELELENLMGNMGMTRAQLEAQIRDIKQQIFEIEEAQIEPAQYQIDLLTRQEELEINSLTILGQTRDKWEEIKNQVELARTSSDEYADDIERADGLVQQLIDKWSEVPAEVTTIHTIIENRIQQIQNTPAPTPAPAPVASTQPAPSPAPTGPVKDQAWVNSMAIRVLRGDFGVGQARKNALGADYQRIQDRVNQHLYTPGMRLFAKGGYVASYMANGGMTKPLFGKKGTDTVPAMLTPGEFVIKKWAVDKFGVGNLNAINQGNFGSGSVYNYNMSVNVRSDANPDEIARTVMAQIKRVDAQRIRGNRF